MMTYQQRYLDADDIAVIQEATAKQLKTFLLFMVAILFLEPLIVYGALSEAIISPSHTGTDSMINFVLFNSVATSALTASFACWTCWKMRVCWLTYEGYVVPFLHIRNATDREMVLIYQICERNEKALDYIQHVTLMSRGPTNIDMKYVLMLEAKSNKNR